MGEILIINENIIETKPIGVKTTLNNSAPTELSILMSLLCYYYITPTEQYFLPK